MADTIIFDIETKKSFDEVGGRENLHKLGISVLCAYSYDQNTYNAFEESELDQFQNMLKGAGTLIGFNSNGFDIPVLESYFSLDSYNFKSLDLMDGIVTGAGFRVALNNLAQSTLGIEKSADGLQALEWYRRGEIEKIKKYCLQDVKVTKDLYEYGKKHGHVLFEERWKKEHKAIPVAWGKTASKDVFQTLNEAFADRKSVEIDYVTAIPSSLEDTPRNMRAVDIHKLNRKSFEGFCHLRHAKRVFKVDRVLEAKVTDRAYKTDEDVQSSLF